MKPLMASLAGLVVGLAAGWWLRPDHAGERDAARRDAEAQRSAATQSAETLAAAEKRVTELTAELSAATAATADAADKLKAAQEEIAALKKRPLAETQTDEAQKKQFGEMLRKIGRAQVKTQLEGNLAALKDRLQLTAEQEKRLRALIEQQGEDWMAALDRFIAGQAQPGDFAALAHLQRGGLPAESENLLSPEQNAGWTRFAQEEKANRIEMQTTQELLALQAAGGLTAEQKDQAFIRLSELATAEDDTDWAALRTPDAVRGFFEGAFGRRVEALQPVLSEPQMALYRRQIETQRQLLGQFMGLPPSPVTE